MTEYNNGKKCCNESDDNELAYKKVHEDKYDITYTTFYICSDCKSPLLDEDGNLDVVSNQMHLVDDLMGLYMKMAGFPEWEGNLDKAILRLRNV